MKKPRPAKSSSRSNSRTAMEAALFDDPEWADERNAGLKAALRESMGLTPDAAKRMRENSFITDSYFARPRTITFDEWESMPREQKVPYVVNYRRRKKKRYKALGESERTFLQETQKAIVEYLRLLRLLAAGTAEELERIQDAERWFHGTPGNAQGRDVGWIISDPGKHVQPERLVALAAGLIEIKGRLRKGQAERSSQCISCGKDIPQPRGKRLFCSVNCAARDRNRRHRALKSTGRKPGRPKSVS